MRCEHYNGYGYCLDLVGQELLVCKQCYNKLSEQIFEQEELEKLLDD